MATHEAVDADAPSEDVFDIVRDNLAAVEVVAQVVRRFGEVHNELVDVVAFPRAVNVAAVKRPIETAAKLVGVLPSVSAVARPAGH